MNRRELRTSSALEAKEQIRGGTLRGAALLERLLSIARDERDAWLDVALGIEDPLPADEQLPPHGIPYLPSAVEVLMVIADEAPVEDTDVFVDLGSGLGRAVIFMHLVSGGLAVGVEFQARLVALARARSEALRLPDISFVQANAAETDVDGTVFFLYCPFSGETLNRVLIRLESIARRHPILICAHGFEIHDRPWLVARPSTNVEVVFYKSSPLPREPIG